MAEKYATDPLTVYSWSPWRFDFNLLCFMAQAEEQEAARGKSMSDSPPQWPG